MNLQEWATYLLTILAGMGGIVPIVSWLKSKLNTTGFWSLLLTAVVSVVFGLLTLWKDGQLLEASFENFFDIVLTLFFASQLFYRLIKKTV
jgi:hypothetical protein